MLHECQQYDELDNIVKALEANADPFPKIIEIHPTDNCNNRCDYCFHGGGGKERTEDIPLSLEEYDSLFEEMVHLGILGLSIAGGGEPFCDSRTLDILRVAHQKGLETRIVTNGNLLNQTIIPELLKVKEVRFSVDTVNPKTYSRMRNVPERLLERTLNNIRDLKNLRDCVGSQLSIGVSMLITTENHTEVADFCSYMLQTGVDAVVIKQDIYGRYEIKKSDIKIEGSERIDVREKCGIDITGMKCFVPYFKVAFNPFGDLYSCCLGSQPSETNGFLFGNFHHKSFVGLWEHSKNIRRTMRLRGVSCEYCNSTDYTLNRQVGYALDEKNSLSGDKNA